MSGTLLRPARLRAHGPKFLALAVLLLIFGPSWSVNPASAQSADRGYREVGGERPPAPPPPPGEPWDRKTDSEIEVGVVFLAMTEDDMDAVYGLLPVVQARYSAQASPKVRLYLGAGYGRSDGDPYYDLPFFEGTDKAELQVVPCQLGFRGVVSPGRAFVVNLGVYFEATWVRETLPAESGYGYVEEYTETGWIGGVGLTAGPEWRSADGRRALGIEAGVAGVSGSLGRYASRDVNLSGYSARVYLTTRL